MQIYYQSSEGQLIDLISRPYMMLTDTGLFNYERKYTQLGNAFPYIADWANDMVVQPFKIVITADNENEYLQNIARLTEVFDRDIGLKQSGRLYVGDWYLDCYIFSSTKLSKYLKTLKTTVEFQLVAEDGDWKSLHSISFNPENAQIIDGYDYSYDYPFDYGYKHYDTRLDNSDSYIDSDIRITIYGHCTNPEITIGDNIYRLNETTIGINEKVIIDSTNHTITRFRSDGSTENLFDYRDRANDIFAKVTTGINQVDWDNSFRFDVDLIPRRAEPKLYTGEIEPVYPIDGDNLRY